MTPCRACAMLLISCGIKRVVCEKKYHAGKDSEDTFAKLHIPIEYVENSVEEDPNQ